MKQIAAPFLESSEGALLRLYEGYWLRWQWSARRRASNLERKLERRRVLRAKVATNQATPADRVELAYLDSELAHRPREPRPQHAQPTGIATGDPARTL